MRDVRVGGTSTSPFAATRLDHLLTSSAFKCSYFEIRATYRSGSSVRNEQ